MFKPSETLPHWSSASDESLTIRDNENSDAKSENIEVRFSLNQSNITESEFADEFFGPAFKRSFSHIMENYPC